MESIPISIRGTIYPSARQAAVALGTSISSISRHLNAGTLDKAGLTQRTTGVPCTFNGTTYPSYAAAARDLGVSAQTLNQRFHRAKAAQLRRAAKAQP